MRTTLIVDDDVLAAAKDLAKRQHRSLGKVISALAREALQSDAPLQPPLRNGVPLLRVRPGSAPVTPELVNCLRDGS
jgi:hypothetical protein